MIGAVDSAHEVSLARRMTVVLVTYVAGRAHAAVVRLLPDNHPYRRFSNQCREIREDAARESIFDPADKRIFVTALVIGVITGAFLTVGIDALVPGGGFGALVTR